MAAVMLQSLRFLAFILLLPVTVQAAPLNIRDAWIPEAPPMSSVMAAFMVMDNSDAKAVSIRGVSSAQFERVEMHLSVEENGVAKMLPQKQLNIAAHASLELKSGSYHLMLFNPHQALKAGDKVELVFMLDNGDKLKVQAEVKKSDGAMMDHSHHMHH
jgi:copper(I)-binding protein